MGTQTVKTTRKTKSRKRKTGGNSGYIQCNMCHGTGRQKKPKRKKFPAKALGGGAQGFTRV